jgi:hypothetical protein
MLSDPKFCAEVLDIIQASIARSAPCGALPGSSELERLAALIEPPKPRKAARRLGPSLVALVVFALGSTGCAVGAHSGQPPSERRLIAPGVALVLSEHAGPEARRIAAEIEAKYSSELIAARPAAAPHWPAQ